MYKELGKRDRERERERDIYIYTLYIHTYIHLYLFIKGAGFRLGIPLLVILENATFSLQEQNPVKVRAWGRGSGRVRRFAAVWVLVSWALSCSSKG